MKKKIRGTHRVALKFINAKPPTRKALETAIEGANLAIKDRDDLIYRLRQDIARLHDEFDLKIPLAEVLVMTNPDLNGAIHDFARAWAKRSTNILSAGRTHLAEPQNLAAQVKPLLPPDQRMDLSNILVRHVAKKAR